RRIDPATRLYSYQLNEDVLGWACLELSRPPLSESDPGRLMELLKSPDAVLIAERAGIEAASPAWSSRLELVIRGRAGGRPVGLYRLRRTLPGGPLSREAETLAHSAREQEPSHQHGEDHRRHHRGDLGARGLPNPEGSFRDQALAYQDTLDDEVQDQGDG